MSLKIFHIVFIVASILISAGVAGWGVRFYLAGGPFWALVLAVVFLALGVALVMYGLRVWVKLKEV